MRHCYPSAYVIVATIYHLELCIAEERTVSFFLKQVNSEFTRNNVVYF